MGPTSTRCLSGTTQPTQQGLTGDSWITPVLHFIWTQNKDLWNDHNKDIYNHNVATQEAILHAHLPTKICHLQACHTYVLAIDCDQYFQPDAFSFMEGKTSKQLQNWINNFMPSIHNSKHTLPLRQLPIRWPCLTIFQSSAPFNQLAASAPVTIPESTYSTITSIAPFFPHILSFN